MVAVVAAVALLATVTPSRSTASEPPVAPGFWVTASNGYVVHALFGVNRKTGDGAIILIVEGPGGSVTYGAPATVTETSVDATIGEVARVDVHFSPSGATRTERVCGKLATFLDGRWEGTIELHGEEGYASLATNAAVPELKELLGILCIHDGSEGVGGHSPGARLTAGRNVGGASVFFGAMKNSPTRPASFFASISEHRAGYDVERAVSAPAKASAFIFDVPKHVGEVHPPRPFTGHASFKYRAGGPGRLRGNLRVDFPGHSGVPLAGPDSKAHLIRAVLNPSHPFALVRGVSWVRDGE